MGQPIIWACGGENCADAGGWRAEQRAEALRALHERCTAHGVALQVTGCLDQCDDGPIVVARPPEGTHRWFGLMGDPETASALADAAADDALEPEALPSGLGRRRLPHRDGRRPRSKRR